MRTVVAVVADDLTGAADAGIGFRRAGLATTVIWTGLPAAASFDAADVLAVDAGTRAMSAEQAVERTMAIVTEVRRAGVLHLYKKIDSTLRGHVGDEIAASCRAWHQGAIAIVAPAFPAMGRTTREGEQRVEGAPLRAGSIARIVERSGLRADQADLGRVRSGTLHLALEEACVRGIRAVVCDAETDHDLAAIARAGFSLGSRALWVGTGGLAAHLAPALGLSPRPDSDTALSLTGSPASGPTLVVAGSRTSTVREQVRALVADGTSHVSVSPSVLADPPTERAGRVREDVATAIRHMRDVVVSIGAGEATAREDARLPRALGELLRPLAPEIGALVVTGGDTARGVLDAWGVSSLALLDEVQPGMPIAMSSGAIRLPVVTKAGGFGGPQALAVAIERLRHRRSSSVAAGERAAGSGAPPGRAV